MRRYSSLQWRLTALIVGGSVLTAVIAAGGFCWLDLQRVGQNTIAEVTAIGNIVADQVGPAILFQDGNAAGEILNSLGADQLIQSAILYDSRDNCMAVYRRVRGNGCPAKPPDGISEEGDRPIVARPVQAGSDRLGTLVLQAVVPSATAVLRRFSGAAALIIAVSLLVAAVVGAVLQSKVSKPILGIANMAEHIAATHRFENRVEVDSTDELRVLAGSLNSMLDEIERRDAELAEHRRSLELEIAERSRVNMELRLAKERAEEAARLKSEFLANMSHEIRTPMNGVIGMISLVLQQCTDETEREQLGVAQVAAQSLVTILNDILDLSKLEAGKMTIEAIDFDLPATLRDALRLFDIQMREKNLDLRLEFLPNCPEWVQGDPVRMRQIIINLVGNAVKFTNQGSVRIVVGPTPAGTVQFRVRDTGIGIPKEKLQEIFEAFTQADGSHTRRFGGTGLGLTISRRLAGLMGGKLWAQSEPGSGSEFCVELPLEARSEPAAQAVPEVAKAGVLSEDLRILVAEDNAINQRVIQSMLRRQGWSVTLAVDGEEALRYFLDGRFDLVLMDIQMPGLDGLEATKLIRAEEERRKLERTPILALTAHTYDVQHQQCRAAGMDGVITKPVTVPGLLAAITPVLEQKVPGRT